MTTTNQLFLNMSNSIGTSSISLLKPEKQQQNSLKNISEK